MLHFLQLGFPTPTNLDIAITLSTFRYRFLSFLFAIALLTQVLPLICLRANPRVRRFIALTVTARDRSRVHLRGVALLTQRRPPGRLFRLKPRQRIFRDVTGRARVSLHLCILRVVTRFAVKIPRRVFDFVPKTNRRGFEHLTQLGDFFHHDGGLCV